MLASIKNLDVFSILCSLLHIMTDHRQTIRKHVLSEKALEMQKSKKGGQWSHPPRTKAVPKSKGAKHKAVSSTSEDDGSDGSEEVQHTLKSAGQQRNPGIIADLLSLKRSLSFQLNTMSEKMSLIMLMLTTQKRWARLVVILKNFTCGEMSRAALLWATEVSVRTRYIIVLIWRLLWVADTHWL